MKDIAREAGVAQALLHYYFDTKDRLLEGVVGALLDEHFGRFREELATARTERERREIGVQVLRRKVLGDKRAWRLLFEVLANAARDGRQRGLATRFAKRRTLIAQQIGTPDAEAKALLLDALMLGLAAERLAGASEREVEAAFAEFLELTT